MQSLNLALKLAPITYVTRDLERALGGVMLQNYFIITNTTSFAKSLAKKHANIILIASKEKLDTHELLQHPKAQAFLKRFSQPTILVFKNTLQIEKLCSEHNWKLLNPSATLANKVEEKISQIHWLGPLAKYLPPHEIKTCKELTWQGEKFIVQFNRSHTGNGTMLIESPNQIAELKNIFPNREVRVTKYIIGPAITNNNVVYGDKVFVGNINYQITGLSPFTDGKFVTIGNDWAFPHQLLSKKQKEFYHTMATEIGEQFGRDGWKGLFGIDAIVDEKTGQIYFIEINARQAASTTYESELQRLVRQSQPEAATTFEAHLMSLLKVAHKPSALIPLSEGAQIIQRVTAKTKRISPQTMRRLAKLGVKTINYPNTALGSDLLRIQTKKGIIEKHEQLNELGLKIAYAVDPEKHFPYRAGVIIIRNNRLLLIKRVRDGREYYTIPGGKPERNETLEQTAIREGIEETGLRFKLDPSKKPLLFDSRRREIYFFTKKIFGKERLGEQEIKATRADNSFELVWISKKELREKILRQSDLKEPLAQLLK